jgi:hypothetical protein
MARHTLFLSLQQFVLVPHSRASGFDIDGASELQYDVMTHAISYNLCIYSHALRHTAVFQFSLIVCSSACSVMLLLLCSMLLMLKTSTLCKLYLVL